MDKKEEIKIRYNSNTFNLQSDDAELHIIKKNSCFKVCDLKRGKRFPLIDYNYGEINIVVNKIHHIYVILQFIKNVTSLQDLSELEWDYNKWSVNITSDKTLPDWANILNCLLNFNTYNIAIKIGELEKMCTLNDKRGWGGERPREVYYKYGFPLYTSKTKKSLKNGERLFECPFPICRINPKRKAVISDKSKEKKCFTCGIKDGEKNRFGNICRFEKGHFDPHINGGAETAGNQCKWCNSFYKDKVSWSTITGKPYFNSYAILRDAPKNEIIKNLKRLGFTQADLQ